VIEHLSVLVSILMIIGYLASVWFSLYTHKHLYIEGEVAKYETQWSLKKAVIILFLATVAVAWVSEILVNSINPIILHFGWTQLFIGVIFVAIIGNAAEHASAIMMAKDNRMDLSLNISIGSATQIATFVAPLLVLLSLLFKSPMNLVFTSFELISVVLAVLIVNSAVADGESNWLEGLQLVIAYGIIATGFFFFR
jgi:Ca2+:H+ antiporter